MQKRFPKKAFFAVRTGFELLLHLICYPLAPQRLTRVKVLLPYVFMKLVTK